MGQKEVAASTVPWDPAASRLPKRKGKPPVYQNEAIINPLKEIWLAANLPCSKRLKVMLPIWLPGYVELFGELPVKVTQALLKISPPTIDRMFPSFFGLRSGKALESFEHPDGMFAVTFAGGAKFIQDGGFFMTGGIFVS